MKQSTQEESVVYLLKRKSDSEPYVGITLKRRLKQRMGYHKRSKRFRGIGFDYEILEESTDRSYIEKQEEYWIQELDTYNNGLNDSPSGKGWGHNSPNFTTLGFVFSDESRKKMSESAKKRAAEEGFEIRSQRSKSNWDNPEYVEKQKDVRKGKRLGPLKISDEQVNNIRDHYKKEYDSLIEHCKKINEERHKKNPSWRKTNPGVEFGKLYQNQYGCSSKQLENIVLWKTRTKVLPSLYGKS